MNTHCAVEMLHPRTEELKEEHIVCLTKVVLLLKREVLVLLLYLPGTPVNLYSEYCTEKAHKICQDTDNIRVT